MINVSSEWTEEIKQLQKAKKMKKQECKAFDYVKYDEKADYEQRLFKERCIALHEHINTLPNGRAKALACTKLEECYMWIGKAIRDEQLIRNANTELQESRVNS
jgi:hypothetical protein